MEEGGTGRFYGCYLLTSMTSRCRNLTYIGFTVNPRRRIRQHNGEIASGARFTRKGRPWEMVLCIHGFQTRGNALQFEWAWQHPKESKATRNLESSLKNARGLKARVKLAFSMLSLPEWSSMKLTVQFFTTKYAPLRRGCQPLPNNMHLVVAPMDDLPSYEDAFDDDQTENPASESDAEQIDDRIDENENGRHAEKRAKRPRLQEKPRSSISSQSFSICRDEHLMSSRNSPVPEPSYSPRAPLRQRSSSPIVIVISPTPVRSCTMKIIDLTDSPIPCWTTSP